VYAGEVVLATLTVKNVSADSGAAERVNVRFSLVRKPGQGDSTYAAGPVPRLREEENILRASVPVSRRSKVLYAVVRIGDSVERLSTGLEP
jgi:hypothetical protein